jgi:hypothetical protein
MDEELLMKPQVVSLATEIYIDLVVEAVEVKEASVTMSTSAENLAKLSFKLANAFVKVQNDIDAENLPKNQGFKVGVDDLAQWGVK